MQRGRTLIVIAAVIAAAALLFPFFTAPTVGDIRSTVHMLPFGALAVGAAVALAGDRGESLNGLPAIATAAAVTAGVILTGATFIDAVIANRDAAELGLETTVGTGLWLTAIAAAMALVGVGVAMSRRLS